MEIVRHYFTEFDSRQLELFSVWETLLKNWNDRLNLISRKDIENLAAHHLLHALSIAKAVRFVSGTRVIDIGTGGGLPGLPLAIAFPNAEFTLVDSIGKKVDAVRSMAADLGLKNVTVRQARAETLRGRYDYVLGRAVTALPKFIEWTQRLIQPGGANSLANGWLYLKGSLYREELNGVGLSPTNVFTLSDYFDGDYFREKYLVHLSAPVRLRR